MQSYVKRALKFFPVLIFTQTAFGQVVVAHVDSANGLAFNNSRKLAVDADDVVSLVFHDKGEIFYTESNDKGLPWLTPLNVSLNSGTSEFPAIVIDSSGRKHIVWQDNTLPDNPDQFDDKIRIYHKNFKELNEISQRSAIAIGESVGNSLHPSITVGKDDKLYAAWAAFMGLNLGWEINFSEGTLAGQGLTGSYDWTHPVIPGDPLGIGSSFFPSIDIQENNLFIAWLEESTSLQLINLIKFRYSDGWSKHFNVSYQAIGPFSSSTAGIPHIITENDTTAHLVFQEMLEVQNNTFDDVFYLEYHPSDTMNFGIGENMSQTEETSSNPVIILDNENNLHAVWEQKSANKTNVFVSSRDFQGWHVPRNISMSQESSFSPQIAVVEQDSLLVVWLEGDTSPYRLMAEKMSALVTSVRPPDSNNYPEEFILLGNYPNPFNAGTSIRFYVPNPATVELLIWNIRGQLIKTLYKGGDINGSHTISWDGTNNRGEFVSSGIYLITLKSESVLKSIQAVLIK